MNIVLVSPPLVAPAPARFPPLGLASIGAVAQQAGHRVTILDAAGWTWDELRCRMEDSTPDVLGVTCWTIERGQAWEVLRLAREVCPHVVLVAGGPHASAFPEHVFVKTPADYVVIGEGEHTFRELLDALARGGSISTVAGLAYRHNGGVVRTDRRSLEEDLDRFPMLLHEQFDYSHYKGLFDTPRRAAAVMTSRGCPFRCIYCSSSVYWGRRLRNRSVSNVLGEVEYLYHEKGVRAIFFLDDNLLVDAKRCVELSQALCDHKLDIIWAALGTMRVDVETLRWMKKAGCYRIEFGVESGSPKILKNIGKSFTVEDARRTFRLCREVGIRPYPYLLLGSPGETLETVERTISLMRDLKPDGITGVRPGLWILPNTDLYELSLRKGIITENDWLRSDETFFYTGEHSAESLVALADYFNKSAGRGYRPPFQYVAYVVVEWIKDMAHLWRKRVYRLVTEPRELLKSIKRRFLDGQAPS